MNGPFTSISGGKFKNWYSHLPSSFVSFVGESVSVEFQQLGEMEVDGHGHGHTEVRQIDLGTRVVFKHDLLECVECGIPLLDLPAVVQDLIIAHMDLSSKKSLRQTCTYFHVMITRKVKFVPVLSDATADTILNRTFSCNEITVSDLVGPRSLSSRVDDEFSDITRLSFYSDPLGTSCVSQMNFFRIIRHCTQLSQLLISGKVLLSFQIVDKHFYKSIRLDGLRTLKLEFDGRGQRYSALEALHAARFPQLQELIILIMPPGQQKLSAFEFESITKVLVAHHLTIRHLHIYDYGYVMPRGFRFNIFLTPLRTAPILGVEKVQLISLEIVDAYDDPEERIPLQWAYAGVLIENQRELQTLQLVFPSDFLRPMIQCAITQCHKTLRTYFHLGNTDSRGLHINLPSMGKFNCADLRQCFVLKHLRLYSSELVENFDQVPTTLEELFWDAPITRPQLNHILNMKTLTSLNFGTTSRYIPTTLVIRALCLPALTYLFVSNCDVIVIQAILLEWFQGVLLYTHPHYPTAGARFFINRKQFNTTLPNFEDLEIALGLALAVAVA